MGATADVLARTLELLENEKNWTQGVPWVVIGKKPHMSGYAFDYSPEELGMCITGALAFATHELGGNSTQPRTLIKQAIAAEYPTDERNYDSAWSIEKPEPSIVYWNDCRNRTHAEIISVLEKAHMKAIEEDL